MRSPPICSLLRSPASGDQLQMLPRPRPPAGKNIRSDERKILPNWRKISRQHSSSRHNPGAETCQAGTLITRHTAHSPEQTRLTPGACDNAAWHVTCHAGSGECYTARVEGVLCCKVPSGAEYHCAETGGRLQEKRNTCFIYSEPDTCPIISPFLSPLTPPCWRFKTVSQCWIISECILRASVGSPSALVPIPRSSEPEPLNLSSSHLV